MSGHIGTGEALFYTIAITQEQVYNDVDYFVSVTRDDPGYFASLDLYVGYNVEPTPTTFVGHAAWTLAHPRPSVKVCSSALQAGV